MSIIRGRKDQSSISQTKIISIGKDLINGQGNGIKSLAKDNP
jgi:hypothetical protein